MAVLIFFTAHWYLSLFSQTFFYHRYASHAAFTMSKSAEHFFYIFSYIVQGASYMSPHAYAIMHRMHHAYTDTEKDPHSPKFSKNVFAMMKRTNNIYMGIYDGTLQVEEKFKKNVPSWPAFDKWALTWTSSIGWSLLYGGYYVIFATAWWMYLLIPIHILMGPVHGTIINWFAHKYGYTNFKMNNTSKNLFPLDIFMLGESYHNNHHKYPARINFGGVRWHEIDPVYPVILLLDLMHVIQVKETSRRRVDLEF
ncbi:MAG: acyl-CoA desaturase [Bacteroidetes bacterium]|nr:acyl-CoA desaturase [Bacteroidota bacterium]